MLCLVFALVTFEVPGGKPQITEEMKFQSERTFFYYEIRYLPFSEDLLKKCLDYEGVKYSEIVILQSRLETGYYSSDIFLKGNNLFGMRYPSHRPTVAAGIYKEHARYAHWSDSVIDYALWQEWYLSRGYRLGSDGDNDFYLVFLRSIPYAEDPRYISKLVKISRRDLT
jgi:flagellum-specific peptidoglycan hydrolase FlgJ